MKHWFARFATLIKLQKSNYTFKTLENYVTQIYKNRIKYRQRVSGQKYSLKCTTSSHVYTCDAVLVLIYRCIYFLESQQIYRKSFIQAWKERVKNLLLRLNILLFISNSNLRIIGISRLLKIPRSTVNYIVNTFKSTGSGENLKQIRQAIGCTCTSHSFLPKNIQSL